MAYWVVRSSVQAALKTHAEGTGRFSEVMVGEKERPDKMPCCMLIPGVDTIVPDSNQSDQHMIENWMLVVLEHENVGEGLQSAIEIAGDLYDDLTADHTLGGVVDEVYVTQVDPRYLVTETYTWHWVAMRVVCRYQMGRP